MEPIPESRTTGEPAQSWRRSAHAGKRMSQSVRNSYRRVLAAVCLSSLVLLMLALAFLRYPAVVLGSGSVNPEAKLADPNPALTGTSSVLLTSGREPVALQLRPHSVALTFDDGPSARWTPEIQRTLDSFGVPGTFFVIGSNAAQQPDIVRQLVAAGHEIGNHTYTHPEMGRLSVWRIKQQLAMTDRVVLGITGQRPLVYRPPYSGTSEYLSPGEYRAASTAGLDQRLLVLSDRLPRDFDVTMTVDQIVEAAVPKDGESAVITLHDAGGDRTNTVQALQILIPLLKAEGYSFVRASEIVEPTWVPESTSPPVERRLAWLFTSTLAIVAIGIRVLWWVAAGNVVLGILRILVLLLFVHRFRRTRLVPNAAGLAPYLEPVTVIVPAYNEEVGIGKAVASICANNYPNIRVIVVDDGSDDDTVGVVEALDFENVTLIKQVNSGKPAALNAGLALTTTDVVVMVDGDTIFDPNTIFDAVQPFRDPAIGAVAGNAKVGNRASFVARLQHVEYTVASEIERRFYGQLGVSPCVPGAIGAFRKLALHDVGGVSDDTLAEDSDLTIKLARAGWLTEYVPTARAWTECPTTWSGLLRQRRRWSYGVLQVITKHKRALFLRGPGGRLARVAFPYQLLVSYAMAVFAPAVDLLMLYDLLFAPSSRLSTLAIWLTLNSLNTFVNLYAMRLDGEEKRGVWWVAFAQQFMYRQVLYIAAIRAIAAGVLGVRMPWQTIRRVGGVARSELKNVQREADHCEGSDESVELIDLTDGGPRRDDQSFAPSIAGGRETGDHASWNGLDSEGP